MKVFKKTILAALFKLRRIVRRGKNIWKDRKEFIKTAQPILKKSAAPAIMLATIVGLVVWYVNYDPFKSSDIYPKDNQALTAGTITVPSTSNVASFVLSLENDSLSYNPASHFVETAYAEEDTTNQVATTEVQNTKISASIKDNQGNPSDQFKVDINSSQTNPEISVTKINPSQFPQGEYRLYVTLNKNGKEKTITQNFAWGVLAINSLKSIYTPNETAKLAFGVLNEKGETQCDAELLLSIEAPNGDQIELSTSNNSITKNPNCRGDSKIEGSDYAAFYEVQDSGIYRLRLTAITQNGKFFIDDELLVQDEVAFDVERTQYPTRIYPAESYDMILTVTANQDFTGTITETLPMSFEVTDTKVQVTSRDEQKQTIVWDVNWKKGQTTTLEYSISFPPLSPEFYLVGPLVFTSEDSGDEVFKEARQWQIASDSVVVSGGITTSETQFGGMQRKIVYVNSNWYAFYNDGADVWYKKSANGSSWGSAVDVDSTDADNYNPTVSVSGNIIDVFWIDDGSERIEGKRIDTASADAQGTLCTGPSEGTIGSTFMPTVAALSATDAVAGFTDSSSDGEFNFYEITGLNGTCTITDVQPGNIVLGTGISAGDRPVLVPLSSTKVALVFQDGNLSYGEYDTIENEWKTMELNIASVTDNNYSVVSDGAASPTTWILTQDAGNTTDTNFYSINGVTDTDFAETQVDADVGAANQDGLQDIDVFCVAADDCKMVYVDNMDTTTPDIIFRDCNNASCSSSTAVTIDSDCGTTNSQCNPKIHCSSGTDCHIVYFEVATAPDIFFVDCDGANNSNACSTTAAVNTNADFGGGTSTTHLDIDCPTGDNCKFIYGDDNNNTITFVDCADDQCAVATDTLTNITVANYGTSVVGPKLGLDCPSSTTCKIVTHDIDSGSIIFVDCSTTTTPETCAGNLAADTIQTSVGTTADRNAVDIDCIADGTDCKVIFTNDTNNDMFFADCNDTDCDAATITTFDSNGGTDATTEPDVDLYCVSATDCKFLYNGALTADAEKLYFVDCDNAACTTGGVIDTPGPRFRGIVDCVGGSTDCKMVYYEGTTAAAPTVQFADCDRGNCYPAVTDPADPWTGETNVSGVSLSYDSSNSDLIASILMDASETAYYMTSDASTISWGGETAYDGFSATGDMDNISTPDIAAGTGQMGALARQGSNVEFDLFAAATPALDQNHFRFRNDTTALNTDGGWLAAEDTGATDLQAGDTYRLRFEVANTGTATATNYDYRIEYAAKSGTCAGSSFATLPVTATTEPFEMVVTSHYTNLDAISASRLSATGSFANGVAVEDASNSTGNFSLTNDQYTELEYAFTPTSNAVPGNSYCFRLTNAGSTTNYTYSVYPEATIANLEGIVLNWGFNEATGTTAYNSLSSNYSGTITGGSWETSDCIHSSCLQFNGTTSKVATTSQLTGLKAVSFWAKPTSNSTTFLQITGSAYVSASNGTLSATGFTNPVFYVNGQRSKTITANQWNHIVVTTGTGIDTTTFTVGNNSSNYYSGLMDEVKLYSTAITAEEIRGLYSGRGATDPVSANFGNSSSTLMEGLVGYWKFDESSGNASDTSGHQNTLTNSNSSVFVGAIYGHGADLEASSTQYFSRSHGSSLDITSSFSLSAWIKPESTTAATQFNIINKTDSYTLSQYGDEIRLSLNSPSNYTETTNANLSTGTWYLVTAVYDASQQEIKIFINGVQMTTSTSGTIPASITNSTKAFNIGAEANGSTTTLNLQVGTSSDDGEVDHSGLLSSASLTNPALSLGNFNGNTHLSAARFTSVAIPQGTSITSATLSLTASDTYNCGACTLSTIAYGDDVDNSAALTTSNMHNRTLTTANSGAVSIASVTLNQEYTWDVTSAVQEIVDRAGWSSSNALSLIVRDNSSSGSEWQQFFAYDGSTTKAPKLDIVYGSSSQSNFYDGVIDEARMYNRALAAQEVQGLYAWAPGPVVYHTFDDGTGTSTVADRSGNQASGTLGGSVSQSNWVPGQYGGGYDFSSDFIESTDTISVQGQNQVTIMAWIKPQTLGANQNIYLECIAASCTTRLSLSLNTSNQVVFSGRDDDADVSATDFVTTSTTIPADTWTHIAAVYDSVTGNHKIYINGVATINSASSNTFDTGVHATEKPKIGSNSDGSSALFDGYMDEFKMYHYARTAEQIITDMNAGHPVGGSPVGSQVGYWKFDDMSGTTAQDSSLLDNDLTLSAASWTASAKYGGAWNGTNTVWLSKSDDADLDFTATENFSISTWVKSDAASNPGSTEYIVNKAASNAAGYAIYFNTSGQVCLGVDDDSSWGPDSASCSADDFYDGTWHHVIAIRDASGTDTISVYVDGVRRDLDSDATTATLENSLAFYVGDRDGTNNGDEFTGDIDELKLYRAALTSDQIKVDFNQGKSAALGSSSTTSNGITSDNSSSREYCIPGDTTFCDPPVLHAKFDENTGTALNNIAGTTGLGTIVGADWTTGKLGNALNFNGSSDRAYFSDDDDLDVTSDMTMSAWVYLTADTAGFKNIFSKGSDPNYYIDVDSLERLTGSVGTITVTSNSSLSLNKWYFVSLVFDETAGINNDNMYAYINGILDGSTLNQNWGGTAGNTQELDIGAYDSNIDTLSEWWPGKIDDIRIYKYARTPAQMAWDYNQGAPIAHYKFDECTGTTAYNSAENGNGESAGNNGTISAGDASGANDSVGTCDSGTPTEMRNNGTTGKISASLDMDTENDEVNMGDLNILDNTSSFSTSFWVNFDGLSTYNAILSKYSTSTSNIVIQTDGGGTGGQGQDDLVVGISNGSSDTATSTTSNFLTTGVWYHITVIYNGTLANADRIKIFVNGKQQPTSTNGTIPTTTPTNAAVFGVSSFNGKIDDLRIYNYPLTQNQINSVLNNGVVRFD